MSHTRYHRGGTRRQAGPALSRRAFAGLAGPAGLASSPAAAAASRAPQAPSTGTVKIGYVSPRTGPDAAFASADPFVLGKVRAAFARGLTIGGRSTRVEIVTADSQSSDTRAAQVAQQLITQDNVDIMLTTSAPETVNPVSDQCESAHVPCIGTIVPWQSWFLGRGGTIGRTAATSSSFKYTYLYFIGLEDELAAQSPGWKDPDQPEGRRAVAERRGRPGVPRRVHQGAARGRLQAHRPGRLLGRRDRLHHDHQQVQVLGVEIVQGCPLPPDFATFWKQASPMGYRPRIASIAKAILFPSVVVGLGPLGENLLTDAWWTPGMPWTSSLTG